MPLRLHVSFITLNLWISFLEYNVRSVPRIVDGLIYFSRFCFYNIFLLLYKTKEKRLFVQYWIEGQFALFNNNKPINWISQHLHKYAKNNNRNENISFIPTFSIRQYFFFSQSTKFKSSDFQHIIFVLSPKTFIWSICFILRLISIEMLKAKVTVVSVCCFICHTNANCKAIIYFDIKFGIHVFYLK